MTQIEQVSVERKRTGWDIVWGILLIIGGLIILGDVVIATAVSVLFIGWTAIIFGAIGVIASFFKIGKGGGFWSTILAGALLFVLGLLIVRHPLGGAFVFTIMAGFLFLVGGIVRIVAAFQTDESRWVILISGIASLILGLIVLFSPVQSTYTLLGILLGVQILIDGFTLLFMGRIHVGYNKTTVP